jgi:hypothetical protein
MNFRADTLNKTTLPLDLKPEERGLTQGALLERYIGALPPDLADLSPSAASYARWADYDRVTWTDWLRSRGASADAVKLMTIGGDSRALSALYVLRQYALLRGKRQYYKIQGGMDRLPQAMAAALGPVVRYNSVVGAMDHSGDTVLVDYMEQDEPRRAAASRVIVTVPLPLLRDVDFYPELSGDKQKLVAELPYFEATRVLVQTYSRFWHDTGLSGYARTDQPAEVWDCTYDLPGRSGILGATVGGGNRQAFADGQPEVAVSRGREDVSGPARPVRERQRDPLGAGAVVAWRLCRLSSRADDVYDAGHRAPRRARPLCGGAHLVLDGMDGGRAAVRRARRPRDTCGPVRADDSGPDDRAYGRVSARRVDASGVQRRVTAAKSTSSTAFAASVLRSPIRSSCCLPALRRATIRATASMRTTLEICN